MAVTRAEVREWLAGNLVGEFAGLRGLGGPGREHESFPQRLAWDRRLAQAGWTCLDWPAEHGGRAATVAEQIAFHEEYAEADAPARVNHVGENLLGPTLIAHGTPQQRSRFLPAIRSVRELWCQGYSEPEAGSDLAAVRTSARLVGDEWVLTGQKVWTSLAQVADWCFVLARTEPGSSRHHGLSYLLVPMRQPGIEVRPIRQLTWTAEFNEVFFDGARTAADLVVGAPGDGWRVAMATLGFERGPAMFGQLIGFRRELAALRELAGDAEQERLARAAMELDVLHAHLRRTAGADASVTKLFWAGWHQRLGELAMRVLGRDSLVRGPETERWQRLFLFSRADTIYGGSDEIQRTIIAERVLGLPKQARP